jgi:hypothetical protein
VPERLDQRQAVSFITRWIETERGVAIERRDGRIVGVGKDCAIAVQKIIDSPRMGEHLNKMRWSIV